MKRTLLPLLLLLVAAGAQAQYYVVPNTCAAGYNPGKLNNDIEQTSTTGWAVVHNGSASSPAWSSNVTIPFAFSFNGNTETAFKVSTSGVLTFNTAASTAPSYTNTALPSSAVPAKAVCVWGIRGTGANDQVRTKTFGSTPNRQLWVQFNSYSGTGSAGWTYWAIVLEETTNKIYVVDQRTYNAPLALTIGVQVDSLNAVMAAGSPAIDSKAKLYALDTPGDNVYYEFTFGTHAQYDMTVSELTIDRYLELSKAPFVITGTVRNLGADTVTAIDLNYSVNGGATQTATYPFLNHLTGDCFNFSHTSFWTPSSDGVYTIKVWATAINGNNDQVNANDTATTTVSVHSITANRLALVEEFTQASNGPSAAQHSAFNPLIYNNPSKTANIRYHVSWPGVDPMYSFNTADPTGRVMYYSANALSYTLLNGEVITGFKYDGSPENLTQAMIDTAYNEPGLFNINLNATYIGNQLSIAGSTKALVNTVTGPFTVQVALVEDPVTYSTAPGTNGEIIFPFVLRKMFPSANGTSIGMPALNQTDTFNYSYTIPSTLNTFGLNVVVFVQDELTKKVFQSASTFLSVGIEGHELEAGSVTIYPNPAGTRATLALRLAQHDDVRIGIFNLVGEKVYEATVPAAQPAYELPVSELAPGMYLVSVATGNKMVSKRMVVAR